MPESAPEASRRTSIGVIIPARNEALSIALVLAAIPDTLECRVVVVDNRSDDGTGDLARANGATVLREEGHGYGRVVSRGVDHFRANPVDIIVFLDGDYSDYPEVLPELVEPIVAGRLDMVVSTRMNPVDDPRALPPHVVYGNRFCVWLMNRLFATRYTDMGPFRAVALGPFLALGMRDTNYGWNAEMQIRAELLDLRVSEFPVRYRRRIGVSKISGTVKGTVSAGAKIIYTILRLFVLARFGRVPGIDRPG